MSTIMEGSPLVVFDVAKSHIQAYQRTTKTGKVVQVHEHEDSRMSHAQQPGPGHNGGPAMDERPAQRRSPPGHDAQRIPTRLMGDTAAKKGGLNRDSHEHTVGAKEMRANPKLWEHNVGLLRHYPGTPDDMRDAPADQLAEHTMNRWKDNLLWLHDKVPEETRQRSKLWYDGARKITDKWAGEYGLHPASIAGCIAALSPQKDWYQNVSCAKRVIETVQTKQDHAWDDKMTETVMGIEAMAKYPDIIKSVTGKKLSELTDGTDKAFWVRAYDEAHNDKSYPVLSPEGDEMGPAQKKNADKKTGQTENRSMAWGSLVEIKKALLSIEANGDLSQISPLMGSEHKVRNFYNNIVAPHSDNGEITADTHAVAAAELRPMAGSDEPVLHNFGSSMPKAKAEKMLQQEGRPYVNAKSDISGVSGTYGLMADAYRRAAKERGILPREMQSITWEAVRGMFEDTQKTDKNRAAVDGIWKDASAGKISTDEARNKIHDHFGGITPPTWHADHPSNTGKAGGAGAGDPDMDAGKGRDADAGGVRGSQLGRQDDGGAGAGGAGAGEPDTRDAAAEGGSGPDADGRASDFDPTPSEVEPEAPKGPKVTLNKGKSYDFTYHDEKSGVAVQARGKLVNWGESGAQFLGEDGNVHKVPWTALAPKDKAAIQAQDKPAGSVKAGSSTTKKSDHPLIVFAKSDGFGSVAGIPVVVFAQAVAAQGDAQAAPEAPAAAADLSGVPAPEAAQEEHQGPEQPEDKRFSYLGHAFRALRNFWSPKN